MAKGDLSGELVQWSGAAERARAPPQEEGAPRRLHAQCAPPRDEGVFCDLASEADPGTH